mgnify:CR=1 FL=1
MIFKSNKAPLGLEALLINCKDNIFLVIQVIFMVYIHKMFMEKTLPESQVNVSINETQLVLISKKIKNSKPVIKTNSLNLILEEINSLQQPNNYWINFKLLSNPLISKECKNILNSQNRLNKFLQLIEFLLLGIKVLNLNTDLLRKQYNHQDSLNTFNFNKSISFDKCYKQAKLMKNY